MYSRIKLAIAIFKVTSDFIGDVKSVFMVPILVSVFVIAWMAVWLVTAAYIFSVGDIRPRTDFTFLTTVTWTKETRYIFIYNLFGLLWINSWIIGMSQFIIAAAAAQWYFSHAADTKGKGSICKGFKWGMVYHCGSIAFGAFLIALVQMIRIIFEYYAKKMEKASPNNCLVKACLCLTRCCLWCLEKCVKFISKNAYIQIALTNKNFCRSAFNAMALILKNAARFGAVSTVGCIFMFVGKLTIMSCSGLICYLLVTQWEEPAKAISSPIIPVVIACIIGHIIGAIFLSVYSFASDTMFQCFLLDEEMADSGKGRPPANRPARMNAFVQEAEKNKGKGCCC